MKGNLWLPFSWIGTKNNYPSLDRPCWIWWQRTWCLMPESPIHLHNRFWNKWQDISHISVQAFPSRLPISLGTNGSLHQSIVNVDYNTNHSETERDTENSRTLPLLVAAVSFEQKWYEFLGDRSLLVTHIDLPSRPVIPVGRAKYSGWSTFKQSNN